MTENELELLEGLRSLAVTEPVAASPVVEQKLLAAFRARAARRRRALWGSAAGSFAAAAVFVTLFLSASSKQPIKILSTPPAAMGSIQDASQPSESPDSDVPQSDFQSDIPQARYAVVRTDEVTSSFYPLPEAADLPAIETAMVVRVEVPIASLELMGVPLGGENSADPVEADVLLGQDGLARGVRLVQ